MHAIIHLNHPEIQSGRFKNYKGEKLNLNSPSLAVPRKVPRKVKPKPSDQALPAHEQKFHGFVVMGMPHGHEAKVIAAAKMRWATAQAKAKREHDKEMRLVKRESKKQGDKNPPVFDFVPTEFGPAHVAKAILATKLKKFKAGPYSMPQAAEDCAAIVRKMGWLHVKVEQLIK